MINTALSAFADALHMPLRNQVEKMAVLENLVLIVLCLDETIDDRYVTNRASFCVLSAHCELTWTSSHSLHSVIMEIDSV